MSYLVLARKYRPRTFDEVVGQGSVARTLRNAIKADRVAHAYLFAGPRGIGKTTMARLLARALNCARHDEPTPDPCGEEDRCDPCRLILEGHDLDVIEIDGASNRGIDEIRQLRDNVKFAPARSRYKVYVIDEVHMLTDPAFNALLKTLEEPPPHVKFLFATTTPQKVPETVRSRCQTFDLRRIKSEDIAAHLGRICEGEGFSVADDLLAAIAESTRGGMRDAVSLLDQLITLAGDAPPTLPDLEQLLGIIPTQSIRDLVDALGAGDAAGAVRTAGRIHDAGIEPEELLHQLLDHLHELLLASVCGAEDEMIPATVKGREVLRRQREAVPLERVVYMIRLLAATLRDIRLLGEGRILVEVALVRLARSRDVRALHDLRSDLDALVERLGGVEEPLAAPRAAPAPNPRSAPSAAPAPKPPADALRPDTPPDEAEPPIEPGATLEEEWTAVLERIRSAKPSVAAFLGVASPVRTGDRLSLTFAPDAGIHRAQIERAENRDVIEAAIRSVMGGRIRVSFTTREASMAAPKASASPDGPAELAARAREDPLVQRVCDTFQGRVVHVRKEDVTEEDA